ncbi:M15 family metallopeptidase [Nocardioides luti]|uniref:M15 family metallopeptidase n=1 Tax=Nocardioides luti TaxID=2761101 RepID=UPI0031B5B001
MVAAVLPALLLAACQGSDGSTKAGPDDPGPASTTAVAAPEKSGSAVPAVADPEHAVDEPGPRKGQLTLGDILVWNPDSLSPETLTAISRLKGVVGAQPLAMAQVSIENKLMNVAAVDPSTYRNFTPAASAETQDVWDRVAGGELALDPELKKSAPITKAGYLHLGSDEQAPDIHIGAFAPQVGQVDAVVNETWIKTLGMKPDNAIVINTGQTSPESLRKKIEQLAGSKASVQMLDAVARYGLDPKVQQTAFLVGSVGEAVGTFNYSVLGGGRIAPEASWVAAHITTQQVPILGNVTCNKLIFPQLIAALNEVEARGLTDKIHPGEYAGCYYPRFIAGTTSLSNHSFGLALDLNTPGNQRGTVGEMDRGVVDIFKKWGFAWGGDWHYTDPMHFEADRIVNPG